MDENEKLKLKLESDHLVYMGLCVLCVCIYTHTHTVTENLEQKLIKGILKTDRRELQSHVLMKPAIFL